jgi:hypothetical protein
MSYINNVYIPYVDGFHDKKNLFLYKNYYEKIGFNVVLLEYNKHFEIDYYEIINNLIQSGSEEVYIIIDSVLLTKHSIDQSIELAKDYKALIKPSYKTYIIDDDESINNILKSLMNDEILENFIYSNEKKYIMWPMGGAWIFSPSIFNDTVYINKKIKEPSVLGFDLCYKNSLSGGTIFIQSDSYKISPSTANINKDIMDMYKKYLESLVNLFDCHNNLHIYKNQVLEKVKECDAKDEIFNIEKFFLQSRYI